MPIEQMPIEEARRAGATQGRAEAVPPAQARGGGGLLCQRGLFALPQGVHYLNCAYIAPLSRAVEAAGMAALRRTRVPSRLGPADFFAAADEARARFARLVNAPRPRRVAIVPSVSYGIALAARNLRPRRGQNIVIAGGQFPSNVYAWRKLARQTGCGVRAVAPPPAGGGRARAWSDALLAAIDRDTAAVALGSVDWSDGTRLDLEGIGTRCREMGAAYVIDGIQSVGALPFDVRRVQPDLLVCAAYKWLCGPMGIGVMYVGPRFDGGEPLEETWLGRAGSEDFCRLAEYRDDYQPGAARFDMGGRASFVLLPMLNAALRQVLDWSPAEIQRYCARLTVPLVAVARALGFGVDDESNRCPHLFALRVPGGMDVEDLQRRLAARNVFVSARGNALRISPHVYNDARDVERLGTELRRIRETVSGRR